MKRKLMGLFVIGSFSVHAEMRSWEKPDRFFNPDCYFSNLHIVTLDDEYRYETKQFGDVIIYQIMTPSFIRRFRLLNNLTKIILGTLKVLEICRQEEIDLLVQTDGTPLKYGLPVILPALIKNKPSILTLHSDYERAMTFTYSRIIKWLLYIVWSFLLSNATHIRCVSEYIAAFVYQFRIDPAKVTVIPNKELTETFAFLPSAPELRDVSESLGLYKPSGKVVVLSNGRLIGVKNYSKMIEAFSLAHQKNENLEYWIVGDGSLRAELKKTITNLGVETSVKFLGYFPHSKLRYIYKLSDIFLLASLYEGQSRVIVEALLAKLPIVCTHYGQVCEIVKDQVDGIWVDPQDVNEIANAIYTLSVDEGLRRKLSEHNGFDADQFSYAIVNAKEKQLFQFVINAFHEVAK